MGYHVRRVAEPAVCLRPDRVWLTAAEVLDVAPARRAKWLQEETGLAKAQAERLAASVREASLPDEVLTVLETLRVRGTERARPGQLVIQPGEERRRTSSHYTPKSLTAPIVRRTLEPLLAAMGPEPPSELILSLRVCDPAMGSGAFLVEACRFLADQLVAAWTREGRADLVASPHEDVNLHARRLVAQTCLYGVDKNRLAVGLAKISLWLETMARELPFTFLDHALRHGDSLVGLTFEQIRGFHWQPEDQIDFASDELTVALEEAIAERRRIQELAADPSPEAQKEKEWLLQDAEDALKRVRLIADLIVGAFFSAEKDRERKQELGRRLQVVTEWLKEGGREIPDELIEMQQAIREKVPVFHWMIEFPEVFYAERPDPLDGGRLNGAAWMDAFVGNPPFMSGTDVSGNLGKGYRDWLIAVHEATHGKSDLCVHFFRLADRLIGTHGAFGLIATNSIAEGESRISGLKYLKDKGLLIYSAVGSLAWPGAAAVHVSVVHMSKGRVTRDGISCEYDGRSVHVINSRLRPRAEWREPLPLRVNYGICSQGTDIASQGFILTPAERDRLISSDARNKELIFPYIGGEELNTDPEQRHERYVVNFSSMSLKEAERWPELLEWVRERVKPGRESLSPSPINDRLREYWWRYWALRPEMAEALKKIDKCFVTAAVSKHRSFGLQPASRLFAKTLYVFAQSQLSFFAVLQSRFHVCWSKLLSSSLEERLRYSPSDCFENFPFPHPDPRTVIPSLEDIGQRLYGARAAFMLDTQQGLTATYNLLKDPACHDPRIEELRRLHEDMDRAVLDAYGWSDIPVPPYLDPHPEAFEDEVLDRLFLLNAQRAEEEKRTPPTPAPKKTRGRKPKDDTQRSLLD
ncbi:MAG: type IIL restriction-modification enzyme MmeI [Acidobacteriota bacterium]